MADAHVVDFRHWVENNKRIGFDGTRKECFYVPTSRLRDYWSIARVRQVLSDCNSEDDAARITTNFLRIFSTLVHLGQIQKLTLFTDIKQDDVQMPIEELPYTKKILLREFWDEHWMFCPLEFSKDLIYVRRLHTRHILPVTYGLSLRGDSSADDEPTIEKVEIHAECNTMTNPNTPVVFKIFRGPDMENLYRAEARIYKMLGEKEEAQGNFTKYYASFSFDQTDTRIIVLEYAAMGSLLDFFKQTSPPVTPDDFKLLWKAMLRLVTGLYALHNLDRPPIAGESMNGFIEGIHQDIHPANILVFPHPENSIPKGKTRFNVRFKLADFGLAEVRRVSKSGEILNIKNQGNRMYSAPECYPNYRVQLEVRPKVAASIDVWALGAVYSDVLVWSLTEEPGREDYCKTRREAIAKVKHFTDRGFEACFHDGTQVLDAVKEYHTAVLKYKRGPDHISPRISDFILKEMLRRSKSRTTTDTLMSRADELMQELESEVDVESSQNPPVSVRRPMSRVGKDGMMNNHDQRRSSQARPVTPQTNPPVSIQTNPVVTTPTNPPATKEINSLATKEINPPAANETNSSVTKDRAVDQAVIHRPDPGQAPVERMYDMLGKKRSKARSIGRALDMFRGEYFEGSIETPEMVAARREIKVKGGRDQIFLIDNFDSMRQWMEKIAITARVISYVTKVADNDGMDLVFASESTKSRNYSKSTAVESAIRKMKPARGKCNMNNCLLNTINGIFKDGKNRIKPTSIYVYTDGNWDDADEVKTVIKKSIKHLVDADEVPSTLMFQFIRFGDDEAGAECLRQLDDECKEQHPLGEYDIVDTKPWYDEVEAIVIGSILKSIDK
ncbi:hypothetical protein CEP54_003656 [Fusarium duplospermum]|uniref:Protein kinase domain-containing protein n=1 Tax=Fusarium duplospermum TaxID=1325734 RepID=A0A428QMN0_9HYPO|nr:hypothetical protein CEP54_003656 [Fusarium duplospermum]